MYLFQAKVCFELVPDTTAFLMVDCEASISAMSIFLEGLGRLSNQREPVQ